jgi:hypothetical protein
MANYTLVKQDGELLGSTELLGLDWQAGDIIFRGGESNLRVVDVLEADDPDHAAILVVEEV